MDTADPRAPDPRPEPELLADRAHQALITHLQPLGELSRWQGRAIGFAASVVLGLLVLAAATVWILLQRGYL